MRAGSGVFRLTWFRLLAAAWALLALALKSAAQRRSCSRTSGDVVRRNSSQQRWAMCRKKLGVGIFGNPDGERGV